MQHETSTFPASLGDSFDYPMMTSEYPSKQWSAFGELHFEVNPYHTLSIIDEDERHFNLDSILPIDDNNLVDQGRGAPGIAPGWYNDNIDISEVFGDLKTEFSQPSESLETVKTLPSSSSEDHSKFITDNVDKSASLFVYPSPSPSPSPLMVNLTTQQETNIKKRKKNHEDEEKEKDKDKKKKVSPSTTSTKKKNTQIQQEEIEESHETDEDSGDNSGNQPKLTRKEKNKIAAQKYRAKQRNEASDIAKRCDMLVSENARIRGEIETTRKQIEEYKTLLAQFNLK